MAFDAPGHLERLLLPHERHAIDRTVTRRASHAFVYVDAVIEVRKVGQVVDSRPRDRTSCAETRAHGLEERARRENLRVAVHARLRRRNPGKGRPLDRRVTVATVDAVARDVTLVAELNGLLACDVHLRDPRRGVHSIEEPE